MKTMVCGYKLNNYDATYEPKNFFFVEEEKDDARTIKVIDVESGEEIWIRVPLKVETPRHTPKRNKFMAD